MEKGDQSTNEEPKRRRQGRKINCDADMVTSLFCNMDVGSSNKPRSSEEDEQKKRRRRRSRKRRSETDQPHVGSHSRGYSRSNSRSRSKRRSLSRRRTSNPSTSTDALEPWLTEKHTPNLPDVRPAPTDQNITSGVPETASGSEMQQQERENSQMSHLDQWLSTMEIVEAKNEGFNKRRVITSIHRDSNIEKATGFEVPSLPKMFQAYVHRLVHKRHFENIVMGLILFSCVMQAIEDPTTDEQGDVYDDIEISLTVCFGVEMILKMIAFGLKGYFSRTWNWLDFVVVCEGFYSLAGVDSVKITFIRALRALRPLRSVKFLPGVPVVISGMARSMKPLSYVVMVFTLFLLMASLFGVLLWKGSFRNQCVNADGSSLSSYEVCGTPADELSSSETDYAVCSLLRSDGYACSTNETCVDTGANPNRFMSFDNLPAAMLVLFQVSTLDGWNTVMTYTQHIMGQYTILFFMLIVIVGAYTLVNLVIATILDDISTALNEKTDNDLERVQSFWLNPNQVYRNIYKLDEKDQKTKNGKADVSKVETADPFHDGEQKMDPEEVQREAAWISLAHKMHQNAFCVWYKETFQTQQLVDMCNLDSSLFNKTVYFLIAINGVVLGCDGYGIPDLMADILHYMNIALTACFCLELVIKLPILGPKGYFSQSSNVFDFFCVAGSLVDLSMQSSSASLSVLRLARFFRLFRVLRLVRLTRKWKRIHDAIQMMTNSATNMLPAIILLLLCMFIFSILGMQLFGQFSHGDRYRFDSFYWSFIQIFIVIVGDGWSDLMYTVINDENTSPAYCLFFLALVIIGNYVILNLVLAIVLEGGDKAEQALKLKRVFARALRKQVLRNAIWRWRRGILNTQNDEIQEKRLSQIEIERFTANTSTIVADGEGQEVDINFIPNKNPWVRTMNQMQSQSGAFWKKFRHKIINENWKPSKAGEMCKRLVDTVTFQYTIYGVIILSTILLFAESSESGYFSEFTLIMVELVIAIIFTAEILMKVLVFSFWAAEDGFIWNWCNQLDVFLVLVSLINVALFFTSKATSTSTNVLTVFQSFRPLRLGVRSDAVIKMTQSLLLSVKGVVAILLLLFICWLMYAIVGMQLFKGLLYQCTDPTFPEGGFRYGEVDPISGNWTSPPCSGFWVDPSTGAEEIRDYEWTRTSYFHFDNLFAAMWSLWLFMSMEDWTTLLWEIVDATQIDYQPETNSNVAAFFYFFFGITIFGFYLINLSVGVIADTYVEISTRNSHNMEMTEEEQKFQQTQAALMNVKPKICPPPPTKPKICPPPPTNIFRWICHKIAVHPLFEYAVNFALILLAFAMATDHYGQSTEWIEFQEYTEDAISFFFTVEAIILITALTPRIYFTKGDTIFDFIVTVICLVDTVVLNFVLECESNSSPIINLLRGLRVFRLFSLCWRFEGTKKVLSVALYPSKTLAIVVYIISCSIIIGASIGVAGFNTYNTSSDNYTMRYQNFENLKGAIQLLSIVSTGEMWVDYKETLQDSNSPDFTTSLYFFLFLVIEQFLLVNLFVVIVVHTFDILKERGSLQAHIEKFQIMYAKFDPQANKGITKRPQVLEMLSEIPKPLGLGQYATVASIQWKTDFIMKQHQYTGHFQQLIVSFHALHRVDGTIEDDKVRAITLLRAFHVCKMYRVMSAFVRRRREKKRLAALSWSPAVFLLGRRRFWHSNQITENEALERAGVCVTVNKTDSFKTTENKALERADVCVTVNTSDEKDSREL